MRHGVILLRRDPGISALIVLLLALGIGGNAAIFTLVETADGTKRDLVHTSRDAGLTGHLHFSVLVLQRVGQEPTAAGDIERIVGDARAVDGVTLRCEPTVDGLGCDRVFFAVLEGEVKDALATNA